MVTTNGGHPLDRNLYQAVKGMAAAERIVRDGGIIVMAAACGDGVPAGGAFARLLAGASTPADLAAATAEPELDRWQAQVLGRVLARAEVHLHAEGLDDGAITDAQLVPRRRPRRRGGRRAGPPRPPGARRRHPGGPAHGGHGRAPANPHESGPSYP